MPRPLDRLDRLDLLAHIRARAAAMDADSVARNGAAQHELLKAAALVLAHRYAAEGVRREQFSGAEVAWYMLGCAVNGLAECPGVTHADIAAYVAALVDSLPERREAEARAAVVLAARGEEPT